MNEDVSIAVVSKDYDFSQSLTQDLRILGFRRNYITKYESGEHLICNLNLNFGYDEPLPKVVLFDADSSEDPREFDISAKIKQEKYGKRISIVALLGDESFAPDEWSELDCWLDKESKEFRSDLNGTIHQLVEKRKKMLLGELLPISAQDYVGPNASVRDKYKTIGIHVIGGLEENFLDEVPVDAEAVVDLKITQVPAGFSSSGTLHFSSIVSGTALIPKE
jgi:hypothetical protein